MAGRFSDGLLIGMIVGGAAVFLLGTKKGNKILKAVTEDGFAGLSEIAKELENDARRETKVQLKRVEEKIADIEESIEVAEAEDIHRAPAKRFFRKSSSKN